MRISNKKRFLLLALAIPASLSTPAFAKSDTQYWQTLQASVKLDDKFGVSDEAVFRSGDAKGFYEFENSLLLGYKANKKVTVQAGWVANPQYSHGSYTTMENRVRAQVTYDGLLMIGKAKVTGRMRIESRWRDGFAGTAWRLRPYVKLSVPLAKKLALNVTHEEFIDLNTNGFQKVGGLERMRNAAMLSTPIAKHFTLDFGYLEQHGFVPGGVDSDDHVASIQLSAAF
ncbi:MAG: DUF2490 domain-containing protein [Novosphingobium sp.]